MISNKTVFSFHNVSDKFNLGFNNLSTKSFKKKIESINVLDLKNYELCFDDGYENIYKNVNSILSDSKHNKSIFPISKYIGKYNDWDVNFFINKNRHLNGAQLIEMNDNGWKIGSHGHSHKSYSTLNSNEIYDDLKRSKDLLEELISTSVNIFTPPFGYFKSSYLPLVEKAGYNDIYLNNCYINEEMHDSSLNISIRTPIFSIDSERSIKRKLSNSIFQNTMDYLIHSCSKATVFVKKIY